MTTDVPSAAESAAPRARRILFSLLHAGYLRHYAEPIKLLAGRGHSIHVVIVRAEKDPRDRRLVEDLAAGTPNVTWEVAPGRRTVDGWRRIAWFVRALADLARYSDPRYARAVGLRGRIVEQIELHVRAHRLDPVTRRVLLRLIDRLQHTIDAELSSRWIERCRRLEAAVPPSRRVLRYLRRQRPDVVVLTPLVEFASVQTEYLKAAGRLGIRTCVCIASWDNLTNKGLIRLVPDRVIVWNELQRGEAAELHGIPPERVVATGAQRWDPWFGRRPSTGRDEFAAKVGLDRLRPYLIYLCSSNFIAPDETPFVRRWLDVLRSASDEAIREIGVLVRPHPQNAKQWRGVELAEFGNAAVWPPAGAQTDTTAARDDFYDSLAHSRAVVGINTSAMVESAILGKSVFTLLDPSFVASQEGTIHFHYLLAQNGGFVHVAETFAEHVEQLSAALADAGGDHERTQQFIASFARPRGLDVPVAPLVADAVEGVAAMGPATPERPSAATLCLRVVLAPVAAALGLGAGGTWLARVLRARLGGSPLNRVLPASFDQRARRIERLRTWR